MNVPLGIQVLGLRYMKINTAYSSNLVTNFPKSPLKVNEIYVAKYPVSFRKSFLLVNKLLNVTEKHYVTFWF